MKTNTLRLSCEQLEVRDLPAPVAGVRHAPVMNRPATAAPAVQRMLPPVVTPTQTPAVVALPALVPGTMPAPRLGTGRIPDTRFGNGVDTISLGVGVTVTTVGTGLRVFDYKAPAEAVERLGGRVDLAALVAPAVEALNRTGSAVRAGTAVVVNATVLIGGNKLVGQAAAAALRLAGFTPQGRVVSLGVGAVQIGYTLWTSREEVGKQLKTWADRLGVAIEQSLGITNPNGLIAATRPAPTVVVPRGR